MGFLQVVFPENSQRQSATAHGKRQKLLSVLTVSMKDTFLGTVR